jgi:acetylornithine deacetylase/succinyl-diaminopimelate desuccinylase-like protein
MSAPTTITESDVVDLLSAMVRIESVTPWLIPDGSGEAEIARYIASWLDGLGLEITFDEVADGRPNLLARLRGTGTGPTVCLNAHSDTVGFANWRDRALVPRREGDRLYGLGVADDKGGCASAMLAVRELVRSGRSLNGDVLIACVIDEEGVSIGTEHLVANHQIDYAIVLEPEALPLAITEHQGFGWIDVVVHGKPAHGSRPDEGVDAIVHMAEVVRRLHALDLTEWTAKPDPRNGRTVFHTGTINGGTDYATYPSEVTLGIEIGSQPGETLANRVADIEAIFAEIREGEPSFSGEVRVRLDRDPFKASGHESLYAALDAAAVTTLGAPMVESGLNAWTDAALMQAAGIPTVLTGPLGDNFHAPDEWVSINEVRQMADIIAGTLVNFLG